MKEQSYQELGRKLEDLALQFYLSQSYDLKYRRYKTPFAEVDLIFTSPQKNLVLVEVKSKTRKGFEAFRVSKVQKERLKRAHQYFLGYYSRVESHLAIVSQDGRVEVHKDFLAY